jgi:hypothetical protein
LFALMYPSNILIFFFLYSSNILIFKLIKCVSLCSLQTYFLNIISLKILKFIYHLTIIFFFFFYIFLKENRAACHLWRKGTFSFLHLVAIWIEENTPYFVVWICKNDTWLYIEGLYFWRTSKSKDFINFNLER